MKRQKEYLGTKQPLIWYLPKLIWVCIFITIGLIFFTLGNQLFSNDETTDANSQELETKNTDIFDNQISQEISGEKEPEMFDSSESEEDFEIPAFLRKQKD